MRTETTATSATAVTVEAFGSPSVLNVASAPYQDVPGRVPVSVLASTVNPVDVATCRGEYADIFPDIRPPFVPGWDFAGRLEDGTRVAGMVPWFAEEGRTGTYADVIAADPSWFVATPDSVNDVTAATVPLNALTARQSLDLADLGAGDTLLVTGASGAVGAYAAALAASEGIHVLAVASDDDEAYVASLGAAEVLGRAATAGIVAGVLAREPGGVDAAIDAAVHGTGLYPAIRDHGTHVIVAGPTTESERGLRIERQNCTPDAAQLERLFEQLVDGTISTRVAATLPLSEASAAHELFAAHRQRGRIVLIPG